MQHTCGIYKTPKARGNGRSQAGVREVKYKTKEGRGRKRLREGSAA